MAKVSKWDWWGFRDLLPLFASGRASPAIPHYPKFAAYALDYTDKDIGRLQYNFTSVKSCTSHKRVVGRKADAYHLYNAALCVQAINRYREDNRQQYKPPTVDERIVQRFYMPFMKGIRHAAISSDTSTRIHLYRGEKPEVKYDVAKHGWHRWNTWTERDLHITLPKGWSDVAKRQEHVKPVYEGQPRTLVLSRRDIPHERYDVSEQFLLMRRRDGKEVEGPVFFAEAQMGCKWYAHSHESPEAAVHKLEQLLVREVSRQVGN